MPANILNLPQYRVLRVAGDGEIMWFDSAPRPSQLSIIPLAFAGGCRVIVWWYQPWLG